jgi:Protein of unknown function (DUF2505)
MPRSFDLSVESPVSVEQVHSAFGDEDYWLARLANYGAGVATLDSLIIDADGAVGVATTVSLLGDGLPRLITQLHGGDLQAVLNETWSPIGGGRVRGRSAWRCRGCPYPGSARVC